MDIINKFNSADIVSPCHIKKYSCASSSLTDEKDVVLIEHSIDILIYSDCLEVQVCSPTGALNQAKTHILSYHSLRCSPDNLDILIIGNLLTEGYIQDCIQITKIYISDSGTFATVKLSKSTTQATRYTPAFGCKNSLHDKMCPMTSSPASIEEMAAYIFEQKEHLTNNCTLFYETGALHTSSLWVNGVFKYIFSDIGRHNTIDKLVGKALLDGIDFSESILFTTGRIPSDMVLKAIRANIPVLASRSAPTYQSIELAKKNNVKLVGFVRDNRLSIY